jgi:hypothetical protein
MSKLNFNEGNLPSTKKGIELYALWFSQQPDDIKTKLIQQGLSPEAREGDGNYTFQVKPEHSAFAFTDTSNLIIDDIEPPQRTYNEDEVQEVVRRVVMAMQLSENPEVLFQARCILIAFGIGDPPSETELAKQRNCSRQFVSKKVKKIQQLFNLSPSQFMRSEQACKAYSDAWTRNNKSRNIIFKKAHKKSHTQGGLQPPHQIKPIKHSDSHTTPPNPPPIKESIKKKRGDSGS